MNENDKGQKSQSADTKERRPTEESLEDLELRGEADEVRGGGNEVAIEGFGSFEPK